MREFFNSPKGKAVVVAIFVIGLGALFFSLRSGETAASLSGRRMFVDSTNLQAFPHDLVLGEKVPVKAPSGGNTGYPAELCYWTADGKPKSTPDYVLLNEWIGKKGPTFCPVCHRLVVGHNPPAAAGQTPPPTEQEYKKMHGNSPSSDTRDQ